MIDTDNYISWLQSLKDQGKMQIDIKGMKSVDMRAFSNFVAEFLIQHHYEFIKVLYRRDNPVRDYGRTPIINSIAQKICDCMDSNEYVNREGKFLVRLEKRWKRTEDFLLPSNLFGSIGGNMQNYVFQSREYVIDFTNVFDWPDGHFGKEGSCWWKSAAESLPTFQQGGGWAIRFYDGMNDRIGIGRTWILPKYSSLIFFNTYGTQVSDVRNIMMELLKSYDTEFEFRMIESYNSFNENIPYINGGSGFVITTPDNHKMLNSDKERVNISLRVVNLPKCMVCERKLFDADVKEIAEGTLCEYCYDRHTKVCGYCNEHHLDHTVKYLSDVQSQICESCAESTPIHHCRRCNTSNLTCSPENEKYCKKCYKVVSKSVVDSGSMTMQSLTEIDTELRKMYEAQIYGIAEGFQPNSIFEWNPVTSRRVRRDTNTNNE